MVICWRTSDRLGREVDRAAASLLDEAARLETTTALLAAFAVGEGFTITGDMRISERDAAAMLGYSPAYLKALRQEGKGPPSYVRGMSGCRISYRLSDLAHWIESAREDW